MRNNKLVQINEGEYYLFFNFFKGKQEITLGFPYKGSYRNDVYLSVNSIEQGRISFQEARKFLSDSIIAVLPLDRVKGIQLATNKRTTKQISNKPQAACKICEKQLRGNLDKTMCTSCYNELGRPIIQNEDGFKNLSRTYVETLKLVLSNQSIKQMASQRGLGISTIINHLEKLSNYFDFSHLNMLKPDLLKLAIFKRLKPHGNAFTLSEYYEKLNAFNSVEFTYDEIRHCVFYLDYCVE